MKRHTKTAYAFAASLATKGEPISEAELATYFVAPGYYGPDVATVRTYEKNRCVRLQGQGGKGQGAMSAWAWAWAGRKGERGLCLECKCPACPDGSKTLCKLCQSFLSGSCVRRLCSSL